MWTISREDISGGASYTTGVRIQAFIDVKQGHGRPRRQFVTDFMAAKRRQASKVIGIREECKVGLFRRVGLETEEGLYRILYSLFWGLDIDVVLISIAGTLKEEWGTYVDVFNRMSAFELIDMKRFREVTEFPDGEDLQAYKE